MGVSQVNHTTTATQGPAPRQSATYLPARQPGFERDEWVGDTTAYKQRQPDIPGSGPRRMAERPSAYLCWASQRTVGTYYVAAGLSDTHLLTAPRGRVAPGM